MLEGIVLNKSIISSDCPTGPKEILKNGKYGILFKTKSIKNLEKKLINLNLFNLTKMKKLAQKSLVRFDYQMNNEKYYNLIKEYI